MFWLQYNHWIGNYGETCYYQECKGKTSRIMAKKFEECQTNFWVNGKTWNCIILIWLCYQIYLPELYGNILTHLIQGTGINRLQEGKGLHTLDTTGTRKLSGSPLTLRLLTAGPQQRTKQLCKIHSILIKLHQYYRYSQEPDILWQGGGGG